MTGVLIRRDLNMNTCKGKPIAGDSILKISKLIKLSVKMKNMSFVLQKKN